MFVLDRMMFLFGADHDGEGLDDGDTRHEAFEATLDVEVLDGVERVCLAGVVDQIFTLDPPEVWATCERLMAAGRDRRDVLDQLSAALLPELDEVVTHRVPFDRESYLGRLAALPMPSAGQIGDAVAEVVGEHPGIDTDELAERVAVRLGHTGDEEILDRLDEVISDLLDDEVGPLVVTATGRVVHRDDLAEGLVVTHRLTEAEQQLGVLTAAFDLAAFARWDNLWLATGEEDEEAEQEIEPFSVEEGHLGWRGPAGWLDRFDAGAVLAVTVAYDGVTGLVTVNQLAAEPPVDPALVKRVRDAYDREVAAEKLPVTGEELVVSLWLEDPATFATPTVPLGELCEAAGLERDQDKVADDDTVWRNARTLTRMARVIDATGDHRVAGPVLRIMDVADNATTADPAALRAALAELRDPEVFDAVVDELFASDEVDAPDRGEAFTRALVDAASRPRDRATAHLLAALHAEQRLEPLVAERELKTAYAQDPGLEAVTDRLAWYASDRGDAPTAARLLASQRHTRIVRNDLAALEPFASPPTPLGRNERCWCGSGRKYKQCHLGRPRQAPLADRVGWLWRKAGSFVERGPWPARVDLVTMAVACAGGPDDTTTVAAVADNPIVMDLVLVEKGWFQHFLDARGDLLPDDELALAQAWLPIKRSLYEITTADPNTGLELRDQRTNDRLVVHHHTPDPRTTPGTTICARAVPDGTAHQLVGGTITVPPDHHNTIHDLLDTTNPLDLATWISTLP